MTALSTISWLPLQVSVNYLLTQLLNGIALGMILVLIAFGLSIIFGLMGVVNFAHGEFLLVGTYVALTVIQITGSFLLGLIAAPIAVALLGAVVERFTLRPIYDRDILLQLLLTFGLAEIIREVVMIIWGRTGTSFPTPSWAVGTLDFTLFTYPMYRLFVISLAALIVVSVYVFLTQTDTGLIIRGATADREMVNALGIDVKQTFLVVFAIGSAIAGIAGALIGPLRSAYPTLGIDLIIPAFVVVVVGGLGSLRGSILAGLLIGELMVLTGVVYSPMSNVIIFVFMALLLLVRPRGLFGREVVE
ncbi:branched-chain amino acid ABC transporter permease [Haladaptatus halobius]|uniref:branched-chain amino acid ABC transporter permease n=1 Tax=Haladaptatus halobius TaxID=2884875 RepID=UPI001D0BDCB9|nr:branched-chain amino acid ABC transporter permease [Haladaptatus halobius]